jgi:hypothetical protein
MYLNIFSTQPEMAIEFWQLMSLTSSRVSISQFYINQSLRYNVDLCLKEYHQRFDNRVLLHRPVPAISHVGKIRQRGMNQLEIS